MSLIRLGLIGDNIAASRSPDLHHACARLVGLDLRYDLMIPARLGRDFAATFRHARDAGLRGVNVTLPYKEQVLGQARPGAPIVAEIAAVNTVRFDPAGPIGFNTDHTGFVAAYRAAYGAASPGRVLLIGAGGVGKAVAFGLLTLGAREIIVADTNTATAQALVASLHRACAPGTSARLGDLADAAAATGIVNATPLGMHGYPGSPLPDGAFPRNAWAFDAVYTPLDTPFRDQALRAGAAFLSGYELFFHQGIQAFEIFTGHRIVDHAHLRALLDARAKASSP